jgi:hypothetical protein
MANTLNLGTNGNWAVKDGSLLGYNNENNNIKPLPFDFTRASSATRVNKQGLIETVASGVPRIDFTDANGALLLEPQRTNLITQSEAFDNAAWTKTNATISTNVAISPDGYTNSDKLIDNATFAGHFIQETISITGVHTFSVFAKASESSVISLQVQQVSVSANFGLIYYDLISGQVESGDFSTSLSAGTIQEMGNGWYRCTITYTPITAGNHNLRVFVAKNIGGNKVDYVGNGTDGVLLYGASLELGSYATSYIPTQGSAVTVVADACSQTPPVGVIGQTEGVVFLEVGDIQNNATTGVEVWYLEVRKDDNNSFGIASGGGSPQPVRFVTKIAGSAVTEIESTPFANSKIAIKYTATQFKLFLNGSLETTVNKNIGEYVDVEFMESASDDLLMILEQFLIFPTALTDAECIELTTI